MVLTMLPSSPSESEPQHQIDPSDFTAQVWAAPPEIATAPVSGVDAPPTTTGVVDEPPAEPTSPRAPKRLAPQQRTVLSLRIAQANVLPAAIFTASRWQVPASQKWVDKQ